MSEPTRADLAALSAAIQRLDDLRSEVASTSEQSDACLGESVTGRRVLVIGPGAGDVALALAARGAERVLACEPDGVVQAEILASARPSQVELRRVGWEGLDAERDGTFDIVRCDGLLHRVLGPIALLRRLHAMTAAGGTLLIGSMLLADPERSELLRFVPDRHAGDPSWWFVPGRLAFRWMLQTAGFEVQAELGESDGPRDGFAVVHGYLKATRASS